MELKTLMMKKAITLRALSKKTGIKYWTLHKKLKGASTFKVDEFLLVATALNLNGAQMLEKYQRMGVKQ